MTPQGLWQTQDRNVCSFKNALPPELFHDLNYVLFNNRQGKQKWFVNLSARRLPLYRRLFCQWAGHSAEVRVGNLWHTSRATQQWGAGDSHFSPDFWLHSCQGPLLFPNFFYSGWRVFSNTAISDCWKYLRWNFIVSMHIKLLDSWYTECLWEI